MEFRTFLIRITNPNVWQLERSTFLNSYRFGSKVNQTCTEFWNRNPLPNLFIKNFLTDLVIILEFWWWVSQVDATIKMNQNKTQIEVLMIDSQSHFYSRWNSWLICWWDVNLAMSRSRWQPFHIRRLMLISNVSIQWNHWIVGLSDKIS